MCAVSLHKQCLVNMQIYIVVIFQLDPLSNYSEIWLFLQASGAERFKELYMGTNFLMFHLFLAISNHFELFSAIFEFFSFHLNPLRSLWCCSDTMDSLSLYLALAPLKIWLEP